MPDSVLKWGDRSTNDMHYRHKQVHCHTTERKKLVFTAALFARAQKWKQPKYPSTDEWIKKIWYIYTMEYYSAIKRDKTG